MLKDPINNGINVYLTVQRVIVFLKMDKTGSKRLKSDKIF
jgi:hypothetical protein